MAKFNANQELENYNVNTGGSYFSLADDGDSELVRIMYNSPDDIEGYTVHEIEVQEGPYTKKLTVSCLREYQDPMDACPLCAARYKTFVKFFVPLYKINNGETCMWSRGPGRNNSFYNQLNELCQQHNPIVSFPVEIERHGVKGDRDTTYEMYTQPDDGTLLEDLPEVPNPIGSLVLEKTFDELTTFVNTGSFEVGDNNPINNVNTGAPEIRRRRDVSASGVTRRRTDNSDIPL